MSARVRLRSTRKMYVKRLCKQLYINNYEERGRNVEALNRHSRSVQRPRWASAGSAAQQDSSKWRGRSTFTSMRIDASLCLCQCCSVGCIKDGAGASASPLHVCRSTVAFATSVGSQEHAVKSMLGRRALHQAMR